MFYYNAIDKNCKSVIGAIVENKAIKFKVITDNSYCTLFIINDKNNNVASYKMLKDSDGFYLEISLSEIGLYWYYFESDNKLYYKTKNLTADLKSDNLEKFQLVVYSKKYKTPKSVKGGIIYQIFPDRFCSYNCKKTENSNRIYKDWNSLPNYKKNNEGRVLNNDFYCGNIKGIIKKLDYLKSLNVSIIYLNPINKAYSNHRYDTANYLEIDPLLGDFNDLKNLINKAHKLGIKIILDGVYNHTGDDSIYFNKYKNYDSVGAYNSKKSKYYKWYNFINYPDKYDSWWGIDILPEINKNCNDFQNYIAGKNGVIERYLTLGVDGFRLDVADELSSNFIKKIRKTIKNFTNENFLIGEVWEDATNKIAYNLRREYFWGFELDSVMNYPLRDAIINYLLNGNCESLNTTVLNQINNYPKCSLDVLMNILGTHDTARILTVLSGRNLEISKEEMSNLKLTDFEKELAYKKLFIALVLVYTLYGIPTIYYGDERGLEGGKDPFNRQTINWDKPTNKITNFYKKLGSIRDSEEVLKIGETTVLKAEKGVFIFKRSNKNCDIIVAVNVGEDVYTIKNEKDMLDLLKGETNKKFTIKKDEFYILKPQ